MTSMRWLSRGLALLMLSGSLLLPGTQVSAEQRFPDVLSVSVRAGPDNKFSFDATVSSPYDSPERYADGFRVTGPDGAVLGERTLWHHHASEQPFTRDLYNVVIPPSVEQVTVQARDKTYGYGGKTVTVSLPGRGGD